eukprot:GDKJ01021616.1.p1 GENE.GDKJ01021616.1~~GDKJ01021616.1.p1  ORF type:complete len:588 (-),score=184.26 GDKJ01021616.1:109-1872(-)
MVGDRRSWDAINARISRQSVVRSSLMSDKSDEQEDDDLMIVMLKFGSVHKVMDHLDIRRLEDVHEKKQLIQKFICNHVLTDIQQHGFAAKVRMLQRKLMHRMRVEIEQSRKSSFSLTSLLGDNGEEEEQSEEKSDEKLEHEEEEDASSSSFIKAAASAIISKITPFFTKSSASKEVDSNEEGSVTGSVKRNLGIESRRNSVLSSSSSLNDIISSSQRQTNYGSSKCVPSPPAPPSSDTACVYGRTLEGDVVVDGWGHFDLGGSVVLGVPSEQLAVAVMVNDVANGTMLSRSILDYLLPQLNICPLWSCIPSADQHLINLQHARAQFKKGANVETVTNDEVVHDNPSFVMGVDIMEHVLSPFEDSMCTIKEEKRLLDAQVCALQQRRNKKSGSNYNNSQHLLKMESQGESLNNNSNRPTSANSISQFKAAAGIWTSHSRQQSNNDINIQAFAPYPYDLPSHQHRAPSNNPFLPSSSSMGGDSGRQIVVPQTHSLPVASSSSLLMAHHRPRASSVQNVPFLNVNNMNALSRSPRANEENASSGGRAAGNPIQTSRKRNAQSMRLGLAFSQEEQSDEENQVTLNANKQLE